eukprot:TRINITY_DN22562_c0_g1_i1.p1 TRINITY_DN22562_c0_g1~~TRINITY_DN22562_c0_g1_i1.p1  ORF type:complete len:491 (+),score=48.56 TRINITY_DN22562_c0_g1_i1:26-1474(+)
MAEAPPSGHYLGRVWLSDAEKWVARRLHADLEFGEGGRLSGSIWSGHLGSVDLCPSSSWSNSSERVQVVCVLDLKAKDQLQRFEGRWSAETEKLGGTWTAATSAGVPVDIDPDRQRWELTAPKLASPVEPRGKRTRLTPVAEPPPQAVPTSSSAVREQQAQGTKDWPQDLAVVMLGGMTELKQKATSDTRRTIVSSFYLHNNNWSPCRALTLPLKLSTGGACVVPVSTGISGTAVIYCGGCDDNVNLATCYIAKETVNKAFQPTTSLSVARSLAAYASCNGKVFACGGVNAQGDPLSSCEVFDIATEEWSPLPALKAVRLAAAAVLHGGWLYVVGGCDGQNSIGTCERLRIDGGKTWEACGELRVPRWGCFAAVLRGFLYVGGGFSEQAKGEQSSMERAALTGTSSLHFTSSASMRTERRNAAGVAIGDSQLLVLGGVAKDGFALNTTEVFDGTSWSEGPAMPSRRAYHSAVVLPATPQLID